MSIEKPKYQAWRDYGQQVLRLYCSEAFHIATNCRMIVERSGKSCKILPVELAHCS